MKTKKITVKSKPKRLALSAPASEQEQLEYEKDFSKWANNQARLLKKREFSKLDIDNLIEEIEDLSKRERQRLTSYLENLLMHKLKVEYQPEMHTVSWDASIKESNFKVQNTLSENPSLKPKLKEILEKAYFAARLKAVVETKLKENTFPEKCPWNLKDIFPNLEKKYH